jgi:thiamine pyridinylase
MRIQRAAKGWAACILFAAFGLQIVTAEEASRRTLQFSMYPFIPEAEAAAYEIKTLYERMYPDVELQITFNPSYYDPKQGISADKATVYELDSVFLADFAEKLQPLPSRLATVAEKTLSMARAAAVYNGQLFGVPHWLCSNFVIFRSSDQALVKARSLLDFEKAFAHDKRLLIDLKGKSTLGEMYLTAFLSNYGTIDSALAHLDSDKLDPPSREAVSRALTLAPRWHGRDSTWHNLTGSYGREFGAGRGRAFVSYSEGLHYVLSESHACLPGERCPKQSQITVVPWALGDSPAPQIAWVDLLVIDKDAAGRTLSDAVNLIDLIASASTYRRLLVPPAGESPRYLLPAREDVYRDARVSKAAPLYKQFYKFIKNAAPITAPGLNTKLRAIGGKLDSELGPH